MWVYKFGALALCVADIRSEEPVEVGIIGNLGAARAATRAASRDGVQLVSQGGSNIRRNPQGVQKME